MRQILLNSAPTELLSEALLHWLFLLVQAGSAVSLFVMAVVLAGKSIFNTRTVDYWTSFIVAFAISIIIALIEVWYIGGI